MLFVASEGKSRLFNLETKNAHKTFTTTHIERRGLTYCTSSRTLAAHQSRGCTTFFSSSLQQPVQRSFTSETITCSACTSDGVFFIGGTAEGNIYIWNLLSGQLLHLIKAHARRVTDISISSDQSLFVTTSEDSVCKTWSLASSVTRGMKTLSPLTVFNGHTLAVNACSFMETGYLVITGSSDRTCRIFDALTGRQQLVITVDEAITSVKISPTDEILIVGSINGSLYFSRLYSEKSHISLPMALHSRDDEIVVRKSFEDGHEGPIVFIWFDPRRPDYVIVGSSNGVVLWWNTITMTAQSEAIPRISSGLLSICYVPSEEANSLALFPCVGLLKHPLDPSTTDFSIITIDSESVKTKDLSEIKLRKRHRESGDNTITPHIKENNIMDSNNDKNTLIEVIQNQIEKNKELENIRDRLKGKLQKLISS